ncbi:hypothetical protein ACM66B_001773 [Microbotryomycetes sp. NB124-2]
MPASPRPDTPRLSSAALLPPSPTAFERDLFASSLGSPQLGKRRTSTMDKIVKSVRFYLPSSPLMLSSPMLPPYESFEELIAKRSRSLELQLYGWSFCSMILLAILLLPPDHFSSSVATRLHDLRDAFSNLLYFVTYTSLLITFRIGVARIAYGAASEDNEATELGDDDDVEKDTYKFDAIEGYTRDAAQTMTLLDKIRDVVIQALTLLSSAALLHLPVHALRDYPLSASFAVWCLSTTLVGFLMWDAVRVATKSFSGDCCDMAPPEYERLDDGKFHKNDW